MNYHLRTLMAIASMLAGTNLGAAEPVIIAHRGASGYLPEHTLAAKALAHAQGANMVEQDVVLTKDGVPIVLHDLYLEDTTDVEQKFPSRARADGHWYAIDFTLAEVRSLRAHERISAKTGKPVFANRFGEGLATFEIHTLDEELDFILRLNRQTGREVGFYLELKKPAFHMREGQDIAKVVMESLARFGLTEADSPCWIQCFESAPLKRMRGELGCRLRMAQLIGDPGSEDEDGDDYLHMMSEQGMAEVASYAQAISPSILHILARDAYGVPYVLDLPYFARQHRLQIYPYTLRRDTLPPGISEGMLLTLLFGRAQVDGIITDFPDSAREWWQGR